MNDLRKVGYLAFLFSLFFGFGKWRPLRKLVMRKLRKVVAR